MKISASTSPATPEPASRPCAHPGCDRPLPANRIAKYCRECQREYMTEHRKGERWIMDRPYVVEAVERAKREWRLFKAEQKLATQDRITSSRETGAPA